MNDKFNKFCITFICLLCFFDFNLFCFAQETTIIKTSRKGIFFSLIGSLGEEVQKTQKLIAGGGGRLGRGIAENFLLYLEAKGSVIHRSIINNISFEDIQIKGQYYPWQDLYINFGAGTVIMLSSINDLLLSRYQTGFSTSAGTGYELRLGKKFFLAPEFRVDYKRVSSNNFISPEVGGQLGWHF